MPTYVRWREEAASDFFTVVAYRRQRILTGLLPRDFVRTSLRLLAPACRSRFQLPCCFLITCTAFGPFPRTTMTSPNVATNQWPIHARRHLAAGSYEWEVGPRIQQRGDQSDPPAAKARCADVHPHVPHAQCVGDRHPRIVLSPEAAI